MNIKEIKKIEINPILEKGFVYCAFNIIKNKIYIGYTQTKLKNRIKTHYSTAKNRNDSKNYFHNALNFYEKEDFQWFIIFESNSLEDLKNKEKFFISFFKSNKKKNGYNLTTGGEQCNFNDEVKEKISKKAKERNLSGSNNPFFNKTHSEETKKHLSEIRKGIVNNPNFKNHSKETKKRLSEIRKEYFKNPKNKEKLSRSKKNNKNIRCIETNIVFYSIAEAARQLKINVGSIKNQLYGRSKTAGKNKLTFEFC